MNKNTFAICALAIAVAGWPLNSPGQVTVTRATTTTGGTIEQFAPDAEIVLRTETTREPTRYVVTRETRFVDEAGTPVAVERITRGVPVRVDVERSGDRLIVSRVIVQKAAVIEQKAPVIEQRTTTTTTTERTLTHDEKERLEKEQEAQKKYEKKVREAEKERAEKLKDAAKD